MPWLLEYEWKIMWLGAGGGSMFGQNAKINPLPNPGGGGAQTLEQFNANNGVVFPGHNAGLVDATDITNITNTAAADMVTQLTAALGTINGYATGSP